MVDSSLINICNVVKKYHKNTVLKDINLTIGSGECVVILGHNGAGKTTLMKLMLGLVNPTEGTVNILGFDPAKDRKKLLTKGLGYLPERVAFYESMTGMEVLLFFAKLKSETLEVCDDLLDSVGLYEARNRPIRTYSKGMKQRLGLAQALLGDPQFLLLDEPTTGLDPVLRQEVYALINKKCQQGKTVIISSHSLKEVEAQADRVVIMDEGEIVANGSLQELYEEAKLPVTIEFSLAPEHNKSLVDKLDYLVETVCWINDAKLKIECEVKNKIHVIQLMMEQGHLIDDLDIKMPKLDDVYRYFIKENKALVGEP